MPTTAWYRRPRNLVIAAIVAVVLVAVVAPFVYVHFINDPAPRLTFDDATTTTSGGSTTAGSSGGPVTLDGSWDVTAGSQVQYRANEVLFGQSTQATGSTTEITGSITIDGTSVAAASFTVDMNTFSSDRDQRDGQFRGRIMETSEFPTATFELSGPLDVSAVPTDGTEATVPATGDLTMHGVTNAVTADLTVRMVDGQIQVLTTIPITFSDYGIDDPSGGPARVEDHGELEVLVVLAKA